MMTEHIGQNLFKETHVVLQWNGSWYKLPFYLLEDIIPFCPGLKLWLMRSGIITQEPEQEQIVKLKKILSNQMPLMVAYKMENHD